VDTDLVCDVTLEGSHIVFRSQKTDVFYKLLYTTTVFSLSKNDSDPTVIDDQEWHDFNNNNNNLVYLNLSRLLKNDIYKK
jgi:hypothetical protein